VTVGLIKAGSETRIAGAVTAEAKVIVSGPCSLPCYFARLGSAVPGRRNGKARFSVCLVAA